MTSPREPKAENHLTRFGEWFEFLRLYLRVNKVEIQREADLGQGTITKAIYEDRPIERTTIEKLWSALEKIARRQDKHLAETWRIAFFHSAGITTDQDQQAAIALLRCLQRGADAPDLNS